MKNKMKKLLSVVLAVVMAMSVFAVGASAFWWDEEEDNFYYYDEIYVDHILYLIDTETMTASVMGYELDEDGKPLTGTEINIPEAFEYESNSYTVGTICYGAFEDCPTVRKVTIPETVTYIDDCAFEDASYLEAVIIPETTEFEYFGSHVFDGTPVLGYLAENSADGEIILGKNVLFAYIGTDSSYTVPAEITMIADFCFFLSSAEEIILNDNITEIREFTFASCRNIREITVPESVEHIGEGAFSDCISLEKVNLGDSICSIGDSAFKNTLVKELYLGDNMAYITGAFAGCNTLEKITISEKNGFYMNGDALCYDLTFGDEYAAEDEIYGSLEYFLITSDATSYTVPENIFAIAYKAFYNNKQIKEVILTSPVDIFAYAFEYTNIETIDFSMVTGIDYAAFRGCTNIRSADLSNTYFVGDSAFENCGALKSVTFGSDLAYIGSKAFAGTALSTVDIGGVESMIYEGAFSNCPELTRININSGIDYLEPYIAPNCPKLERVYISDTVTCIDPCAFEGNDGVVFEILKHSYAESFVRDMGYEYEIVGKVPFFTRVARFFTELFETIRDWLFRW